MKNMLMNEILINEITSKTDTAVSFLKEVGIACDKVSEDETMKMGTVHLETLKKSLREAKKQIKSIQEKVKQM